jgi:hypothetical protein
MIDIAAKTEYPEVVQFLIDGFAYYDAGWPCVVEVLERIMTPSMQGTVCERVLIRSMYRMFVYCEECIGRSTLQQRALALVCAMAIKGTTALLCALASAITRREPDPSALLRTILAYDVTGFLSALGESNRQICLKTVVLAFEGVLYPVKRHFEAWNLPHLLVTQPNILLIAAIWEAHPPAKKTHLTDLRKVVDAIPATHLGRKDMMLRWIADSEAAAQKRQRQAWDKTWDRRKKKKEKEKTARKRALVVSKDTKK